MRRQLSVDLDALDSAFEDRSPGVLYYLDLETGDVVATYEETRRLLEQIWEETVGEGEGESFDLEAALAARNLPEWEKEQLREADRVETGYPKHYIGVPEPETHDAYEDMQDFIATLRDERLRERLCDAIVGRGAFRRFKDVLFAYPSEKERWYTFGAERTRQRVLEWLDDEGIEPIARERPPHEVLPPQPPARDRLIAEVVEFVCAARRLPGVRRIALVGSLAADKAEPKDVDLLVTVEDDADLAPLATLGRKLAGHTQGFGRGADVFIADSRGNYLGRTCPWKRCGPGLRVGCDALHCGRRLYLHDDLRAVKLPRELVVTPPVELWPQVVARVPLPADLAAALAAIDG